MIKAEMKYNREDTKAFCKNVKSSKDIIIFYASLFVLYSAGVVGFALYGIETYAMVILCAVQVFILLMFIYLVLTVVKTAPDRELEKIEKKYGGNSLVFSFDDEGFMVDAKGNSGYSVAYSDVKQLVCTEDHYFIVCPEKEDDYIIKKSAFKGEDAEAIDKMLTEKLADKIKRK